MKKSKFSILTTIVLLLISLSFVQCYNTSDANEPPVDITDTDNFGTSENGFPINAESTKLPIDFLKNFTFSNPFNYKNLQIFMISGVSTADNVTYVSLKVAMEKKWVEIIETSEVNELMISNLSGKTIFINAGDIVKGGKQDRTLTFDMVIAPHAKTEKLSSFCVESGRWEQRGEENTAAFSSNDEMLPSRDLKIASKKEKSQTHVWNNVSAQQEKLNKNISYTYSATVDVKDSSSASSLELTLDNKELQKIKEEYKANFKNLLQQNTIGIAYTINGELYNVDIYNNKQLFIELFDKLLDAAIIEAITDLDTKQKSYKYLNNQEVLAALKIKTELPEEVKDLNSRTRWASAEDKEKIVFTSIDRENNLDWIHRNVIIKNSNMTNANNQLETPNITNQATEESVQEKHK